jgi:hypothetical protein
MPPHFVLSDSPETGDWIADCSRCGRQAEANGLRPVEFDAVLTLAGWLLGPPARGDQSRDLCPDCAGTFGMTSATVGKLRR